MEIQGQMLVSVTSQMHTAEEEVNNLKRSASREDTTPEAKNFCVDEAVRQILQAVCCLALSDQPGEDQKRTCSSWRA